MTTIAHPIFRHRHTVTKTSLTSSDQTTPGADFSMTQWSWSGTIIWMCDWLGTKPMRDEAKASPLPEVSASGRHAAIIAWDQSQQEAFDIETGWGLRA